MCLSAFQREATYGTYDAANSLFELIGAIGRLATDRRSGDVRQHLREIAIQVVRMAHFDLESIEAQAVTLEQAAEPATRYEDAIGWLFRNAAPLTHEECPTLSDLAYVWMAWRCAVRCFGLSPDDLLAAKHEVNAASDRAVAAQ